MQYDFANFHINAKKQNFTNLDGMMVNLMAAISTKYIRHIESNSILE